MIPPHPPDVDWIVRIAHGDRSAFDALYARYAGRIMAFVDHLLADRTAAEDATQETFVKVWRSAGRFRPGAPLEPWLFQIARHEAYDAARKRRPRPLGDALPDTAAPVRPPHDDALAQALRGAVAALSAPLREAFVLVRMLGRAHDDAAALLGIPVGTVKSRLSAAETELRRRLGRFAGTKDAGTGDAGTGDA